MMPIGKNNSCPSLGRGEGVFEEEGRGAKQERKAGAGGGL